MAAYAALVSLMYTVEQLQNHHRPPISLVKSQVKSITEKLSFFLDFLEGGSYGGDTKESEGLERRITDAAHAVEDVIESHIVDQILEQTDGSHFFRSVNNLKKNICCFFQSVKIDLSNELNDMDLIQKEVMQIKGRALFQDRKKKDLSVSEDSQRSSFTSLNLVVGFSDELTEIMDKLTGPQSTRQIIPIVGMGGIGKTTLAKKVYSHSLIQHHFDICAWTTISQDYNVPEILKDVLSQVIKGCSVNESELGVELHKCLTGRRYLIVMDDMWSIEFWDQIKFFFTDNDNGSRILITTRQSDLASLVTDSYQLHKKFIDVDDSWNLFCKVVFGEDSCPLEFVEIGKYIAKICRGLPLSICVIGGVLAKSRRDIEYWEYIAENLNSVVNLEDNERCLKILHMSYEELPAYLKPCFLFLGIFPEDHKIRVSKLIELWVAEGFLKPISGKSLKEVAAEYFKSLVDKNLILVNEVGSTGNIKYCKIHDLLRDLCLRQAEKERFFNINNPQAGTTPRRVVFVKWTPEESHHHFDWPSIEVTRSLFYYPQESPSLQDFRLLRIWNRFDIRGFTYTPENMSRLVNLRYFATTAGDTYRFPFSVYRFWNLHTINVKHSGEMIAPSEIWEMPQLQCIKFDQVYLPDPGNGLIVLRNLHTLSTIRGFKCTKEITKRIPNIKKLRTILWNCVSRIDCLHKLESFSWTCIISSASYQNPTFPKSLKKLSIGHLKFEDGALEKIGSLPFLEKLKLLCVNFHENKWETVEGQFCSLKSLLIEDSFLEYWITEESTHFPHLERLVLERLYVLEEIPSEIGEIPTLRSIHLQDCSISADESANRILDQQEQLGNEDLQLCIDLNSPVQG